MIKYQLSTVVRSLIRLAHGIASGCGDTRSTTVFPRLSPYNALVAKRAEWFCRSTFLICFATLMGSTSLCHAQTQRGPLLNTYWDQWNSRGDSLTYNKYCPVIFGNPTPTGCVSTAVSQLMTYYGQATGLPSQGYGSHEDPFAYGGGLQGFPGGSYTVDFQKSVYAWGVMPNTLTPFSSVNNINSVAQLMRDAGVAMDTNYAAAGSGVQVKPPNLGASDFNRISYALQSYFGYASGGTLILRSNYVSSTAWFNRLRAEIDAGRPVIYLMYALVRQGRKQVQEGHCVVVDGYRSPNLLHINFGWGGKEGQYTDYYDVNDIVDKSDSHAHWNLNAGAIVGIQPPTDNATFVTDVTVPDDTIVAPGQTFTKTWRLQNSGSSNWGYGYHWVFNGGDKMAGPDTIEVPLIGAGNNCDVSVNLQASTTAGTYRGYWRLQSASGALFGPRVWVQIKVAVSNVKTFVSESDAAPYEGAPGFFRHGTPGYWHDAWGLGEGNHMLWTWNNGHQGIDNMGDWRPNLPEMANYEVFVFIPHNHAYTKQARYEIYHADGRSDVWVNQRQYNDVWVSLGTYRFNQGSGNLLRLIDYNDEPYATTQIGFDAAQWVRR